MASSYAPILVLGYNRPLHLKRLLLSLSENPEALTSDLYIAIDGPRDDLDSSNVNLCREVSLQNFGFRKITTYFNEVNSGLSISVINNISKVLDLHDEIIVVEDDLEVSNNFLKFMNLGLREYRNEFRVASIHGYQYPVRLDSEVCVFLRGADCWGWATWKNRWSEFEPDGTSLLHQLVSNQLCSNFDLGGVLSNVNLLEKQISGIVDSWAIRWHASMFLQNRMTLYPPESLVLNLGLDGSGTHESVNSIFDTKMSEQQDWVLPKEINESAEFKEKLSAYFIGQQRNRRLKSLVRKITSFFRN